MTDYGNRALRDIDRAFRQLRRFSELPPRVTDGGVRVETSTLLVLEAVLDAGAGTVRQVAQELAVTQSTASRLVTRAEDAGMVVRGPAPDDAREVAVQATDQGDRVRRRGHDFRVGRLADLTAGWPPDDVETFARLLGRFARSVTDPARPARTAGRPKKPST